MGSGIGLFLNEIQFLNLFPANVGFLIGACNALCNVGSFFPLAWKIIIENDYLSYSGNGFFIEISDFSSWFRIFLNPLQEIMWIWFSLTLASLIVGSLIYPWHNLPQDTDNGRSQFNIWPFFDWNTKLNEFSEAIIVDESAYATAYEVLFKSKERNIVTLGGDNPSLFQQLKENAAYLKSPLFPIQMILFAVGNCTVSLSLNLVNDLICRDVDGDTEKFNKTQEGFSSCKMGFWMLKSDLARTDFRYQHLKIIMITSKKYETINQQEFEIVRAIVATAVCILIGFATDFSMLFWNKTASKNKDVQKSLVRNGSTTSWHLPVSLFVDPW